MSDIVKLNIKSKGIKAVFTDSLSSRDTFTELPAILEREKEEHAHKAELELEYKKGFETGQSETIKELEKVHAEELLEQSRDFYNIISTFEEKFKSFEEDFGHLVIVTAERLASKILKNEIKLEATLKQTLSDNLKKVIGANEILIKLNSRDYELLQKSKNDLEGISGIDRIRFESNDNIQIGGCLIESEIGNIDARIESQIKEIVVSLENSLKNKNTDE